MLFDKYLGDWNRKTNQEKDEVIRLIENSEGTFLQLLELYEFFKKKLPKKKSDCDESVLYTIFTMAIERTSSLAELDQLEKISSRFIHDPVTIQKKRLELSDMDFQELMDMLESIPPYPVYYSSILEKISSLGVSFSEQIKVLEYFQRNKASQERKSFCNAIIREKVLPNILSSISSIDQLIVLIKACDGQMEKRLIQRKMMGLVKTINDLKVVFFFIPPSSEYRIGLLEKMLLGTTDFNGLYYIYKNFRSKTDKARVFMIMEENAKTVEEAEILEMIGPETQHVRIWDRFKVDEDYVWNFWDWYNAYCTTQDEDLQVQHMEKMLETAQDFWEIRITYAHLEDGDTKERMLERMEELARTHEELASIKSILRK